MTTKPTRVAPNSAGLRINPNTGKPFTSIAELAAFEHGQRQRAATALALHYLTKGKANGKQK
jgi:hypothetical protein